MLLKLQYAISLIIFSAHDVVYLLSPHIYKYLSKEKLKQKCVHFMIYKYSECHKMLKGA